MRDCESKSAKEFAHWQLQNELAAVHVLYDLALRMDSLASDRQYKEDIDDNREMGL